MSYCCHVLSPFRGPLIVIAIGVGFMMIGSLPVAITIALGTKNSATIIGVGFIGFGLLLVIPGLIWCIVRRVLTLSCCASERLHTPKITEKISSVRTAARSYRPRDQPFPVILEDVNSEIEDCGSCIMFKTDDIEDASSQAALVDPYKEYSTVLMNHMKDCSTVLINNMEGCSTLLINDLERCSTALINDNDKHLTVLINDNEDCSTVLINDDRNSEKEKREAICIGR